MTKIISTLFIFILSLTSFAYAVEDGRSFSQWLQDTKAEAVAMGISQDAVNYTASQARYLPKIIELDRAQPEFITSFSSYASRRINPAVVKRGKELITQHHDMLHAVEQLYGVPKEVLVAFWSLETNYGKNMGGFNLASSLVTLAYEGRRADFFKKELFNLMRMVDANKLYEAPILGSWAGATGHMQFMPSTLLAHGVDADTDGKVDIWKSLPDVFSSAANYLNDAGWKQKEPIAILVKLPLGFDYNLAQIKTRKSVNQWRALGVGVPEMYRKLDNVAILVPQGHEGPAFMVFSNFDVVMEWNRSVNYSLSVALLSAQYVSETDLPWHIQPEKEALSYKQMWALQTKLNKLGYDCGTPDGFPGLKTQASLRRYQSDAGLPADGYASMAIYERLLKF